MVDEFEMKARVNEILNRWPTVGLAVGVVRSQLMIRYLSPIPALYRGFPLHPDDDKDPYVFRIDFSTFGIDTGRVIFSGERGAGTTAVHLDFGPLSFQKQPDIKNPRLWATSALGALAVSTAVMAVRRSRRRACKGV